MVDNQGELDYNVVPNPMSERKIRKGVEGWNGETYEWTRHVEMVPVVEERNGGKCETKCDSELRVRVVIHGERCYLCFHCFSTFPADVCRCSQVLGWLGYIPSQIRVTGRDYLVDANLLWATFRCFSKPTTSQAPSNLR